MTFKSRAFVPVYRTAGIRDIETRALAGLEPPGLMERAGLAAAQIARDLVGDRGRGVLLVAGPGNNGGDAFVVARHLKAWWFKVDVVFSGDAAKNRAEMLCRAANNSYDPALTAASIDMIWKLWGSRPGNILVPGHDLPMVLEPGGAIGYVGEREAAISSWFGDSVEQTTLIQLTGT